MTPQDPQRGPSVSYEEEYRNAMGKFGAKAFLLPSQLLLIKHHRLIKELETIAKKEGIPVVDNIAIVDQNRRRLASWVHLTEEANLRLAEVLKSEIEPYITKRRTQARQQSAIASR